MSMTEDRRYVLGRLKWLHERTHQNAYERQYTDIIRAVRACGHIVVCSADGTPQAIAAYVDSDGDEVCGIWVSRDNPRNTATVIAQGSVYSVEFFTPMGQAGRFFVDSDMEVREKMRRMRFGRADECIG